ncbi:hypothetical protein [Streptomyces sp. NBC_00140]|uniref:hypothetical protein n=1 Tax=Streptomyces sp. NBC_00140 TaxID=2975664 RepID=UPI00225BDB6B|nr:hypothetical protein [Streptomyces sp. NBC_00140]MCX5338243.1 hypothetical protein [Streptomyces sp. NBC_00140]
MPATSRTEALLGPTGLAACASPSVADEVAAALVRDTGAGPAAGYFEEYARIFLRSYLLAAALSGNDAAQLTTWLSQPHDPTPLQILKDHHTDVPHAWIDTLESGLPTSPEERATLFGTALHALRP